MQKKKCEKKKQWIITGSFTGFDNLSLGDNKLKFSSPQDIKKKTQKNTSFHQKALADLLYSGWKPNNWII